MDFAFYRNFLTVAETGSLTAAARRLALAQPALSAQIRTLERCYGVRLVETARGRRGLTLTEAGRQFLAQARRLCREEESLQLAMRSCGRQAAGLLRFSVSPDKSGFFLQTYLLPFSRLYPEVTFQLREEAASEQLRHVAEGSCDFAYANAPLAADGRLRFYGGRQERLYLVYDADNVYGLGGDAVAAASLRGVPLCCNFGCYRLLRQACGEAGFAPEVSFMATTGSAVLAFAAAKGLAAAVAAVDAGELAGGRACSLLEGGGLGFEQTLFSLAGSSLTPAGQAFARFYERRQIL